MHDNTPFAAAYVAEHMRQPVYFNHAVHRLAKQFPQAIWLEAGSNSTITSMANKALGMPEISVFQSVNVTSNSSALQQLANATLNLWKAGLRFSFWPHSRRQTYQYAPMILPPYQFEKHRHWLEFKPPVERIDSDKSASDSTSRLETESSPTSVYTHLNSGDYDGNLCRFRINTQMKEFTDVLSEHILRKTAQFCPATYLIDLAIQAITSVRSDLSESKGLHSQIYNIVNQSPIIKISARSLYLDFEYLDTSAKTWNFKFFSELPGADETVHMTGQVLFQPFDDPRACVEFSRLERLVPYQRYIQAVKDSDEAEEIIQGQSIYNVMSGIIDYGEKFRGVRKLVGRRRESAGRVAQKRYVVSVFYCFLFETFRRPSVCLENCGVQHTNITKDNELATLTVRLFSSVESRLDFALGEIFTQVGGIWANCMARDRNTTDDIVYIISGMEQWMRSPELLRRMSKEGSLGCDPETEWHVLAQHKSTNPVDSFLTDIFVFDPTSGSLEEVILGIRYTPVSM